MFQVLEFIDGQLWKSFTTVQPSAIHCCAQLSSYKERSSYTTTCPTSIPLSASVSASQSVLSPSDATQSHGCPPAPSALFLPAPVPTSTPSLATTATSESCSCDTPRTSSLFLPIAIAIPIHPIHPSVKRLRLQQLQIGTDAKQDQAQNGQPCGYFKIDHFQPTVHRLSSDR